MKKEDLEKRIRILENAVFCQCLKSYKEAMGATHCFICKKLLKDALYVKPRVY